MSWKTVQLPKNRLISTLRMKNFDTCFAYMYGKGPIYYTSNRWTSYDSTSTLFDPVSDTERVRNLAEAIWINENEIVAYGGVQYSRPDQHPDYENHPYIMRSSDAGQTWAEIYDKDSYSEWIIDMSILPSGVGLAAGRGHGIMRTADGGKTWSNDSLVSDIGFINISQAELLDERTALLNLSAFGTGKIVRATISNLTVEGLREKILYSTKIYPNPATNRLTVKKKYWSDKGYSVIDVLGHEVMKGNLNYGASTTSLDCTHLVAGSYTLMVQFEEGSVAAGHFVIMK
jgi:hypothetical protein